MHCKFSFLKSPQTIGDVRAILRFVLNVLGLVLVSAGSLSGFFGPSALGVTLDTIEVFPGDPGVLQQAVNQVAEHGTVILKSGEFRERIVINKPVTLIGEGASRITSPSDGSSGPLIRIQSSGVTLKNLVIYGARGTDDVGAGILVSGFDISNLRFENISVSQNQGHGIVFWVAGKYDSIEFFNTNVQINEGLGISFTGSPESPAGGKKLTNILFEGNRTNLGVINFNGAGGIRVQLEEETQSFTNEIGGFIFRNMVLEANDGGSHIFIQGLTQSLTFEGCWFNGGPFRGFNLSATAVAPSSHYGITVIGSLVEELQTPIPPVTFLPDSAGQRNQFDGIFRFGIFNWIGWSDLSAIRFGIPDEVDESRIIPATEVNAALQGENLNSASAILITQGVSGSLNLSGLQLGSKRQAKRDVMMEGIYQENLPDPVIPSRVYIDATQLLIETSFGQLVTIEEMSLDERFEQSSRMVSIFNPSSKQSSALGFVEMVEGGDVYVTPNAGISIQEVLNQAPDGVNVFIQRGEYPHDTSLNIGRGHTVFFQGGINSEDGEGGVTLPITTADSIVVDSSARVIGFEIPEEPGIAQIEGSVLLDLNRNGVRDHTDPPFEGMTVYLDQNRNGVFDEGEIFSLTDEEGSFVLAELGVGSYAVRAHPPAGFETILPVSGRYNDFLQSDELVTGRNFLMGAAGVVAGAVWEDIDGDGIQDPGEPPFANTEIILRRLSETGQPIETFYARTDSSGHYELNNLFPGRYAFRNPFPSGWILTSQPGNDVLEIELEGSALLGQEFGGFQLAKISGRIYEDVNKNGILDGADSFLIGSAVSLDLGRDDRLDALTVTDTEGRFEFTGISSLPMGPFSILPSLSPGNEILESRLDFEITHSGQIIDQAILGFFRPAYVSGQVLLQTATGANKAQQVVVSLVHEDTGVMVDSARTNANGEFELVSYQPGTFRIQFQQLPLNTRIFSLPNSFSLSSGSNVSDQALQLIENHPPVIHAQSFDGIPEMAPAGTVTGIVSASDPDADPIRYEIVSGNHIETSDVRAWRFRTEHASLFDVTATRVFEHAPPFQPGKLLQGIRKVNGIDRLELYWLTIDGGVYRNLYSGKNEPESNIQILGEQLTQLDPEFYNHPELLINATVQPVESAPFSINAVTGQLTIVQEGLTRALQPEGGFLLSVQVSDPFGGSSINTVSVNLNSINQPPFFDSNSFTRQVAEGAAPGDAVGAVIAARDPESQVLQYSILFQTDTRDKLRDLDSVHDFQDPTNGDFSFNARGKSEKWIYGARTRQWFYVILNPDSKRTELFASPQDREGNLQLAPEGTQPTLELNHVYYENPFLLVDASSSENVSNAFVMDPLNGQLLVNNPDEINPLLNPIFDLTIQVLDSGTPPLSAITNVRVEVEPTKHFPRIPRFSNFRIPENSPAGTFIGQIKASDPDGLTDVSTFEIRHQDSGPGSEAFGINSITGEVFVATGAVLDFETQIYYELKVRVQDTSSRWTEGRVIIDLINVNEPARIQLGDAEIREGNSGTRLLELPITLNSGFTKTLPVSYSVIPGTAEPGVDFEDASPIPGQAVIIPGDKETYLRFNILSDTLQEGNETFQVELELSQEAQEFLSLEKSTGSVTILDDDQARIIDDSDPEGFTAFGSGWNTGASSSAVGGRVLIAESANSTAQWVFEDLEPGFYQVKVSSPALSSVGTYSVWDGSRRLEANIRQETYTFSDGLGTDAVDSDSESIFWNDLGFFETVTGNLIVQLNPGIEVSNGFHKVKIADAVRIEPATIQPIKIFINNPAPTVFGSTQSLRIELEEPATEDVEVRYFIMDSEGALDESVARSGTVVIDTGNPFAQLDVTTASAANNDSSSDKKYFVWIGPVIQGHATIVNHVATGEVSPDTSQKPDLELTGPATVSESIGSLSLLARLSQPAQEAITVKWLARESGASGSSGLHVNRGEFTLASGEREITFEVPVVDNLEADSPNRILGITLELPEESQANLKSNRRLIELIDDDGPVIVSASRGQTGNTSYQELSLRPGISDWVDFNDGFTGMSRMARGNSSATGATAVAQWSVSGLEPGAVYRVSATWSASTGFSSNAPFQVMETNPSSQNLFPLGGAILNQSVVPGSFASDENGRIQENGSVLWQDIGYFKAQSGNWKIQLNNSTSGIIIADSIRIERVNSLWVEPEETESPDDSRHKIYLFDLGRSTLLEPGLDAFVAVDKNSIYRNATLFGWDANRGLNREVVLNGVNHPVLKGAMTGPAPVNFLIGGLEPNAAFELDFLLGRSNPTFPTGTLVRTLGEGGAVLDSVSFIYNPAEAPASLKAVSLVGSSNSNGELQIQINPYQPVQGFENLRFAITALQARPVEIGSSPHWEALIQAADLDETPSSRVARSVVYNPQLQSRSATEPSPMIPDVPWLDDNGPAFGAGADWNPVSGIGFGSSLHYLNADTIAGANDSSTASWTFPNLATGIYRLGIHWKEGVNRSDQVTIRIKHQDEVYGPFLLNQKKAPNDSHQYGTHWEWIGNGQEFPVAFDSFSPGKEREDGSWIPLDYNNFTIEMSPTGSGVVVADSVLLDRVDTETVVARMPAALEVIEGNLLGSNLAMEVALSNIPFEIVSLDYRLRAGTATLGSDVARIDGSLLFEPGQQSAQLLIPVFGDSNVEEDETFFVEWFNPRGMELELHETAVLIVDDDGENSVQPVSDSIAVFESRTEGAIVWRDLNLNSQLDHFEPTALSNAEGIAHFAILARHKSAPIMAEGGIDRATGVPLIYPLSAPAQATVVNSLTTLLTSMEAANPLLDLAQHEEQLKSYFGIDSSVSLTTQNFRAAFQAGYNLGIARALIAQSLIESYALGLGSMRVSEFEGSIPDASPEWREVSAEIFNALALVINNTDVSNPVWHWSDPVWTSNLLNQISSHLDSPLNETAIQSLTPVLSGQAEYLRAILTADSLLENETNRAMALVQLAQFRAYLKREWKDSLYLTGTGELSFAEWIGAHSFTELRPMIERQPVLNPVGGAFSPGQIHLVLKYYSAYESEQRIAVEVSRINGSLGAVTGIVRPIADQATPGEDFVNESANFHFESGEQGSQTVLLGLLDDEIPEITEHFYVELQSVTGGAMIDLPVKVRVSILDDEQESAHTSIELTQEFDVVNHTLTLSWPEFVNGFSELQSRNTLLEGSDWTPVSKEGSTMAFGIRKLVLPIGNGNSRFFRLRIQP